MSQTDFDVIIAGAGPAGSSAAHALAASGVRVAVFDRDEFPRPKPCAGAVSEQCLRWLDHELPAHLIRREFFGGLLCFEDFRWEIQHDYRAGILVRRSEFDAYLLDRARAAGAEVYTGTPVLDAGETTGGHVRVRTGDSEFRAKYLIVAEGASGRLKLLVRPADRPREIMFCLCAEVAAAPGSSNVSEIQDTPEPRSAALSASAPLVLHFGLCSMGYGWIFGQPGQVSVGIGDTMAEFSRPKEAFAAFLGQHGVSLPGKLVGHKIPLGGFRRPVAKGRVFLVGDAGGFTDAVLGEGIGYAVRSGQVAARCIAQSLRNGGHSGTADRYAAAIDLEMGGELRQSLLLAKAMQLMPRWLLRSMLTDPGALSRYVDILAGAHAVCCVQLVDRAAAAVLSGAVRAVVVHAQWRVRSIGRQKNHLKTRHATWRASPVMRPQERRERTGNRVFRGALFLWAWGLRPSGYGTGNGCADSGKANLRPERRHIRFFIHGGGIGDPLKRFLFFQTVASNCRCNGGA